jgi:hypothetical protein
VGEVHDDGDPLTDQTEWVLDRIVELYPNAKSGFEPRMAIQSITEAISALQEGRSPFGLAHSALDASKAEQMLGLLREALAAWSQWSDQNG